MRQAWQQSHQHHERGNLVPSGCGHTVRLRRRAAGSDVPPADRSLVPRVVLRARFERFEGFGQALGANLWRQVVLQPAVVESDGEWVVGLLDRCPSVLGGLRGHLSGQMRQQFLQSPRAVGRGLDCQRRFEQSRQQVGGQARDQPANRVALGLRLCQASDEGERGR